MSSPFERAMAQGLSNQPTQQPQPEALPMQQQASADPRQFYPNFNLNSVINTSSPEVKFSAANPNQPALAEMFQTASPEIRQSLVSKATEDADRAAANAKAIIDKNKDSDFHESFQYFSSDPLVKRGLLSGMETSLGAEKGEFQKPDDNGVTPAQYAIKTIEDLKRAVSNDISSIDQQTSLLLKDPNTMSRQEKLGLGLVSLLPLLIGMAAGGKKGMQAGIVGMMQGVGTFADERAKSFAKNKEQFATLMNVKTQKENVMSNIMESEDRLKESELKAKAKAAESEISPVYGTKVVNPGLLSKQSIQAVNQRADLYYSSQLALDGLDRLTELIEKNGGVDAIDAWNGETISEAKAISSRLTASAIKAMNLGVPSKGDYALVARMIPDPADIQNILKNNKGIYAQLKGTRQGLKSDKEISLKALGLEELQDPSKMSREDKIKYALERAREAGN